jgi:hypothetical protein
METGGGGVGPVVIMARRPFEKKMKNLRKKFRQIVTVSLCQMLSRIVNLLEDLGVLPCLVCILQLHWYMFCLRFD